MKVDWKIQENEKPILYRNRARWAGFEIHHWRILPGELIEETRTAHEINFTLSGTVTTRKKTADGWRKNHHQPGKVCLIPAGFSAKAVWQTEIECLSISLDPLYLRQSAEQIFSGTNIELIETYERFDPLVQHTTLALLGEAESQESLGRMYAESLANTLIWHLLKNYSTAGKTQQMASGGLSGYRLRRAQEFINENLEKDLTLAEVASEIGLSPFHFARVFRRSTGLTPQQYLVVQRIECAKKLLLKDDLPLVEVCLRSGFKNQSHFTTVFRKFTAFTPKMFRLTKHN